MTHPKVRGGVVGKSRFSEEQIIEVLNGNGAIPGT
jgi:hypothetical protein